MSARMMRILKWKSAGCALGLGASIVIIECDECLGGFHLKCLKPPLKEVPEGDWICGFCEAKKLGKEIELPVPPIGKKRCRTLREKLLSGNLWTVRIESIWKEVDGTFWICGHWYLTPEETAAGSQAHNLRRELYLTNDFADVEFELKDGPRHVPLYGLLLAGMAGLPSSVIETARSITSKIIEKGVRRMEVNELQYSPIQTVYRIAQRLICLKY